MKSLFLTILASFLTTITLAQVYPGGIGTKGDSLNVPVGNRDVQETNVPYLKRVHRVIDTRTKQNMVANWPKSRLIDIIHNAALNGPYSDNGVPVYYTDSLDNGLMVPWDSVRHLGSTEFVMQVPDPRFPDDEWALIDTVMQIPLEPEKIRKFRIMEEWIFDSKYGDFRPHIIAIAPLYEQLAAGVSVGEVPLYWVMMKDLEPILARHPVYNTQNDTKPLSYDDWFDFRLFSSYVVGETNVFDADFKYLDEYADDPMEQLFQGEQVEDKLFIMEHDFWEY